jgi:hypothetical protein
VDNSEKYDTFLGQPHGGRSFVATISTIVPKARFPISGTRGQYVWFWLFPGNQYVYTQPDWPYHLPFWALTSSNRALNFSRYIFGSKTRGRATLTRKWSHHPMLLLMLTRPNRALSLLHLLSQQAAVSLYHPLPGILIRSSACRIIPLTVVHLMLAYA